MPAASRSADYAPYLRSGSSRTARHGLDARSPVIPRLEDPAAWDAHLTSTLATLDPVGPLETTLAERAATILWRLGRVARYEREVTSLGRERAPSDLADADARATEERAEDPPDDPRPGLAAARARLRALRRVIEGPPEAPITGRVAKLVHDAALARVPGFNIRTLTIPERLPDDQFIDTFDGWTAVRIRPHEIRDRHTTVLPNPAPFADCPYARRATLAHDAGRAT